MANIMDYLDWRGDLDWSVSAFNEVDNLILSELVYVDFEGIVPAMGKEKVTLAKASEAFFSIHTEEEINARVSSTRMAAFLMQKMAQTKRFGQILLADYINDISLDEQSQFCAMTVQLGDGYTNVVYSGTDSTIVGWKEDFNMSFLDETPGQIKAVEYLKNVAAKTREPLRLMGHSKGRNLAIYAAMHCFVSIYDRVEVIYNNDGPGFTESMLQMDNYEHLLPRIRTIVPEYSIVGMLFEHKEEYEVVASSGSGAGQHDVMSWEVKGTQMVHLSHVDGKALLLDKTMKSWLDGMNETRREAFVDTLFGILEAADIRTIDDLANMSAGKFMELMRLRSSLDREDQELLRDSLWKFLAQSGKELREQFFKK